MTLVHESIPHQVSFPAWCSDRKVFNAWIAAIAEPACEHCGTVFNLTVDHVVAKTFDSKLLNDPSNWQILCRSCNSKKYNLPEQGLAHGSCFWDRPLSAEQLGKLRTPQRRLALGKPEDPYYADYFSTALLRHFRADLRHRLAYGNGQDDWHSCACIRD